MGNMHNPPAFPVEMTYGLEPGEPSQTGEHTAQFPGMSLRDYFAGQALAGQLAAFTNADAIEQWVEVSRETGETQHQTVAREAYRFADAMLAERNKP